MQITLPESAASIMTGESFYSCPHKIFTLDPAGKASILGLPAAKIVCVSMKKSNFRALATSISENVCFIPKDFFAFRCSS